MIIGKNTNMQPKNSFIKHTIPSENINQITNMNQTMQHTDVTSKKEMNEKSLAMLQDRLSKGLISIDEFKKMCTKIGKIK